MQKYNRRLVGLLMLVALVLVIYVGRLMNLQLVQGESYLQMAVRKSLRTVSIPAPRGEIYDRNGEPLVVNKMGYSIKLDKVYLPDDGEKNPILLELLDILAQNGQAYTDSLPISYQPYQFLQDAEGDDQYERQRQKLLKNKGYTAEISAEQVMEKLIKEFHLADLDPYDQRRLAGLLYDTQLQGFSYTNQFTLASGVDMTTVSMVKERAATLPGAVVDVEPIRTFVSNGFASHILGVVSSIHKEDSEKYLEKGYLLSDKVGHGGVEESMEDTLRGIAGEKVVNRNLTTNEVNTYITKQPSSGNNLFLTIDMKLQRTLEISLKNTIAEIAAKGKPGKNNGADANAGAAVLIDVRSGDVLASATYPTYDSVEYLSNYSALANDTEKPLFNRALAGTYPPGSTFKIATALAALESGVISTTDKIRDMGIYTYYGADSGYQPKCWVYEDYGTTHGNVDVSEAIRVSCNYYFYEVGRLMGIDTMNAMCRSLGLGEKTGINLPGEKAGVLAGPDYAESRQEPWYGGDTLAAAIGQSYNLFTPIQLANYIATVVNGGTRYQTQIVDKVMTYHNQELVAETDPVIVNQIDITEEYYNAIMKGMRSVTEDGTASNVFGNYDIAVGGKTGTASASSGTAHGVFVAFAPYENPEIAIAIVIEHGAHGNYAAPVAKEVFDAYFKGIYYDADGNLVTPVTPEEAPGNPEAPVQPTSVLSERPSGGTAPAILAGHVFLSRETATGTGQYPALSTGGFSRNFPCSLLEAPLTVSLLNQCHETEAPPPENSIPPPLDRLYFSPRI